jgi:hypothetical protein
MNRLKKVLVILSLIGSSLLLVSCGTSSSSKATSVNAASWNSDDLSQLKNGCLDSEGTPTKALCECFSTGISNAYSKSEWKIAIAQMQKTGQATQAYMDTWNNCDSKFGSVGSSSPDGPSASQQKQSNFPPCVQVLAPGNSGLSLNDNQHELGRADGQAGYCILPNSGGEKYYYQGR